jgi:ribitol-5-phosphate 2-dehydrogenase (NADP+) / D-ribitol-5-phosphate cytidylyltransferase
MKNIAVILAGGSGLRYGTEIPKQFLEVAGKMVIEHTINIFNTHPSIDEIAIVVPLKYIAVMSMSVIDNKFEKVRKIIIGGQERYQSTLAALKAYENEDDFNILLHDAVRPLISHSIIDDVLNALEQYNAVLVAVPTVDTIMKASSDNKVSSVPDRKWLRNAQTPQAFKYSTLKKAYDIALADNTFSNTDDCGVVFRYLPEEQIFIVDGNPENFKLTHKEDLILLEKLLQSKPETK